MRLVCGTLLSSRRLPDTLSIVLYSCIALLLPCCPTLSAAEKTAADYYVTSLPGQPAGPLLNMHAG